MQIELKEQCDQICQNYATLAKITFGAFFDPTLAFFFTFWEIFIVAIKAKYWNIIKPSGVIWPNTKCHLAKYKIIIWPNTKCHLARCLWAEISRLQICRLMLRKGLRLRWRSLSRTKSLNYFLHSFRVSVVPWRSVQWSMLPTLILESGSSNPAKD